MGWAGHDVIAADVDARIELDRGRFDSQCWGSEA